MGIMNGLKNIAGNIMRGGVPAKGKEQVTYTATFSEDGRQLNQVKTVTSNRPIHHRVPIEAKLNDYMAKHAEHTKSMLGGSNESAGTSGFASNEALTLTSQEKQQGFGKGRVNVRPNVTALDREGSRVPFARRKDNGMDVEANFLGGSSPLGGVKGSKRNILKGNWGMKL